ncbi:hypothetical protein KQ941_02045 [Paenibacillus xylanexedens]|uniref:hypothetical protein n=1 Tax=Paenibacillus xylanexedens TaxID=528191 RepID=UPI001F2617CE|nr:hypothetical protein [Paenibacillus xylanexedens]MCF7753207.1 hypothetical protein [Paenibacillus xylanexedens]
MTYVPVSDLPPHRAMCTENVYYTRAGDNFVTMEHYMLEDAFGRRQKPKLKIYYELREGASKGNERSLYVLIGIENVGKYLAARPAIRIKPGKDLGITFSSTKFIECYNLVTQSTERNLNSDYFFAGGINDTAHPYTCLDVTSMTPTVDWVRRDELIRKAATDSILSFEYEVYAEGCTPENGEVKITAEDIMDFLRILKRKAAD